MVGLSFQYCFMDLLPNECNESFCFWTRASIVTFRTRVGTMGCNSVHMYVAKGQAYRIVSGLLLHCLITTEDWCPFFLPVLHLMYGSSSQLFFILYSKPYWEFIILPVKLYCSHLADIRFLLFLFLVQNVDLANQNGGGGGGILLFFFLFFQVYMWFADRSPKLPEGFLVSHSRW